MILQVTFHLKFFMPAIKHIPARLTILHQPAILEGHIVSQYPAIAFPIIMCLNSHPAYHLPDFAAGGLGNCSIEDNDFASSSSGNG